ncbi:MAG TPA: hypothetical protein VEQ60_01545 [Longimicrobium sp.]|nr:hypothetical protein [Longimicrobium sp.]
MSRSIKLSDEDYVRLERAAEVESITPAEWIARCIPHGVASQPRANGRPTETMADLFAERAGASSGDGRLSEAMGERFADHLAENHRAEQSSGSGAGTSHQIEFPEPVFIAITEEARARGLTPLAWIVANLPARRPTAPNGMKPKTMAERLAGRTGLLSGSKGLPSSDNVAQSFAEHLEAKQREGRL